MEEKLNLNSYEELFKQKYRSRCIRLREFKDESDLDKSQIDLLCYNALRKEVRKRENEYYIKALNKRYKDLHNLSLNHIKEIQVNVRGRNLLLALIICIIGLFLATHITITFGVGIGIYLISCGKFDKSSYGIYLEHYIKLANKLSKEKLDKEVKQDLKNCSYLTDKEVLYYKSFYYVIRTCSNNTLMRIMNKGTTITFKDLCPKEKAVL